MGMDRKSAGNIEALMRPVKANIKAGLRPALFCLSDLYALEAWDHLRPRALGYRRTLESQALTISRTHPY